MAACRRHGKPPRGPSQPPHIPTDPTWPWAMRAWPPWQETDLRKKILYGKTAKAAHSYQKKVPKRTFSTDLVKEAGRTYPGGPRWGGVMVRKMWYRVGRETIARENLPGTLTGRGPTRERSERQSFWACIWEDRHQNGRGPAPVARLVVAQSPSKVGNRPTL